MNKSCSDGDERTIAGTRPHNLAIDVIKILACYAVLSLHFGGGGYGRRLAVPSFMFIAFYLSYKALVSSDWSRLLRRLRRLLAPYLFWGGVGCVYAASTGMDICLVDVGRQVLFGYPYAGCLYYVTLLMVFTFIVFIAERYIVRTSAMYGAVVILCLVAQHSGLNFRMFSGIEGMERYTFGRVAELLPVALAGLGLARFEDRHPDGGVAILAVFGAMFVSGGAMMLCGFPGMPLGFGYQGLSPMIMCVMLCSFSITLWRRFPISSEGIGYVGSLTPGIYFLHVVLGDILMRSTGVEKSNVFALTLFVACATLVAVARRSRFARMFF